MSSNRRDFFDAARVMGDPEMSIRDTPAAPHREAEASGAREVMMEGMYIEGKPYSREEREKVLTLALGNERGFHSSFIFRYEATVRTMEAALPAPTSEADMSGPCPHGHCPWDIGSHIATPRDGLRCPGWQDRRVPYHAKTIGGSRLHDSDAIDGFAKVSAAPTPPEADRALREGVMPEHVAALDHILARFEVSTRSLQAELTDLAAIRTASDLRAIVLAALAPRPTPAPKEK